MIYPEQPGSLQPEEGVGGVGEATVHYLGLDLAHRQEYASCTLLLHLSSL